MYAYVRGKLAMASPLSVVIETGGMGYRILIPASVYSQLPSIGEELLLHTSYVVREQSQALYGFYSEQERELFEVLMGVSGIGPKTALSLVGHIPTYNLFEAISNSDIKTICKVPGIGRKSAERLIIEIRDKLPALFALQPADSLVPMEADPRTLLIKDAMSALINLGYNQALAQKAVKKTLEEAPNSVDLAALITCSLKNI